MKQQTVKICNEQPPATDVGNEIQAACDQGTARGFEPPASIMTEQEFYNQRKWLEIHRQADQLIATKDGRILAAIYKSPDERVREDQIDFIEMLQEWAANLSVNSRKPPPSR
jgi:hypothetical protein